MANLTTRVLKPELLDEGQMDNQDVRRSLLDLRRINKLFGGRKLLLNALTEQLSRRGLTRFSLLDIASASCDLPLAVLDHTQQRGLVAVVFALEYWQRHLTMFQHDFDGRSTLYPICGDAFRAPFTDCSFDFVTCSLFLHHLTEDRAAELLSKMSRLARCAVIVSDLERRALPYYVFKTFSRFFTISPMSRADGLTSFKQSYRKEELELIAGRAGLESYSVERRWPFRLVLTAEISPSAIHPSLPSLRQA